MAKKLPMSVWLIFAVLCVVWGTTYLGIKIGVKYFPPFYFSGLRHVLAGSLFLIPYLWKGFPRVTRRDLLRTAAMGFFMITGGNALLSWAEKYISSGTAGILSALAPLYITFLSLFFLEGFRITRLIWFGLMLCIGGIYFLSQPNGQESLHEYYTFGIILTVFANLAWGIGSVFMKKYPVEIPVYLRTGLQMLIAGGFNLSVGLVFEPSVDFSTIPSEAWWTMAYLVLIGSLVGYASFVYLLDFMQPARLSIHVYVNTVVAVLVGWFFASEQLNVQMFGAMAVILVGVILVNREYAKMAAQANK